MLGPQKGPHATAAAPHAAAAAAASLTAAPHAATAAAASLIAALPRAAAALRPSPAATAAVAAVAAAPSPADGRPGHNRVEPHTCANIHVAQPSQPAFRLSLYSHWLPATDIVGQRRLPYSNVRAARSGGGHITAQPCSTRRTRSAPRRRQRTAPRWPTSRESSPPRRAPPRGRWPTQQRRRRSAPRPEQRPPPLAPAQSPLIKPRHARQPTDEEAQARARTTPPTTSLFRAITGADVPTHGTSACLLGERAFRHSCAHSQRHHPARAAGRDT